MAYVSTLTIDRTKVSADATDFPVFVNLANLNALFWDTVANGGGDIRVYKADGVTELAREVVTCDTATDTGELHFKFTGTLSASVDTVVQIHADGVASDYAVGATFGRNNVWTDYRVVIHGGAVTDSSGNITPTASGNSSSTTAKVGGNSTALSSGTGSQIATGSITGRTVTMWAYNTAGNTAGYFLDARTGLANGWSYRDNPGGQINFGGSWSTVFLNASSATSGVTTLASSTWGYLAYKASAGWTDDLFFGNRHTGRVTDDSWVGNFDELRVTKTIDLASSWITTEYNNQNSPATFYTITTPPSANTGAFFPFF